MKIIFLILFIQFILFVIGEIEYLDPSRIKDGYDGDNTQYIIQLTRNYLDQTFKEIPNYYREYIGKGIYIFIQAVRFLGFFTIIMIISDIKDFIKKKKLN